MNFRLSSLRRFLCLSILLIALTAHAQSRITSIRFENPTTVSEEQIRKVLPIHEGDPYDPSRVEESVSYLKRWGRFADVTTRIQNRAGGVDITFIIQKGNIISGIDIDDTYPFLSERIRRLITVHSGELYQRELAEEQTAKIESFYERQGYEDTTVFFTARINDKKNTANLNYSVRKGELYRVKEVEVIGNTVFPHGYFLSQVNPLRAYKATRLRKTLDKIRKDYQEKGYLQVKVRLADLRQDDANRTVYPLLEVNEGKKVQVVFHGNRRVSRRTFKETIPMFIEGGTSEFQLEASQQAMLNYYRKHGFLETEITYEKKDFENSVRIDFQIDEGPQTRLKKINIIDSKNQLELKPKKIKEEFSSKEEGFLNNGYYQPQEIERDFKNLPSIMKNKGALDAEIVSQETRFTPLKDKALVDMTVKEGPLVHLREIRFEGNTALSTKRLYKNLKQQIGSPASPEKIDQDKETLVTLYSNNAHPYATVRADLTHEGANGTLVYHIQEGIPVTVGEVLVVGNERTQPGSVLRAMRIRPNQPFNYKKILESEAALRRSGSFRSVNIQTIGLQEKEPVVHLVVKLEEFRSILLEVGAAYDTDNFFTGDFSISQINLFGTIRRAQLKLTGGRDIQRGEAILKDPFFFGYPFEFDLSGFLERRIEPAFEAVEGGGAVSFLREFTPRITTLGRYELVRTFFTDVTDATGLAEEDHTTSKFSFSFNYDKRDSFADPRRGFVTLVGFDISNKLIASTFNFLQPRAHIAHYLPLGSRFTLLNFVRTEGIKVFGSDDLTRDEKLFLGGDYSVRGFDEDALGPIGADARPAGGQLLLASTTELNIRLVKNAQLGLFLDNGSLSNDFTDLSQNSLRHAAGFGLRYTTPVGPLRMDYGIKLDRAPGESYGRFHLAFGYAF